MSLIDTFFNAAVLRQTWPLLLSGLWITLLLGFTSILCGMSLGLGVALWRLYAPRWLAAVAIAYIDVFRSIPLLVLLIVIYYALPFVGIRLSPFAAAATALSLVSCAYAAEIFRAGIEAIGRGQFEAARALGLHWWPMMRLVVLPQAMRLVVPPMTGNCINVIKDTALASVVAMPDLLKQATQAQALAANPTPLIGAAILYIAFLLPLVRLVGYLERRMGAGQGA
ncbi:amino acid ABC transporter permease [Marinimicrococcus flavescens]|uniref:Amino acid ABC transporter permease n=1 Tax=Marinimicrococcus flavescens TaxID=3031815 RepID=A0AAP4D583_9PROT|nr:amino acid ABC transporter permease [Marinimicrococcus flavescens]